MNEHGGNNHNLLHICSDFPNQHIYMQLINQLRALGEKQFMFSAVRSDAEAKKQPLDDSMCVRYSIQNILHPWHIPLFRTKIKMIKKALCQTVDVKSFSIIHSHYLYSDGAVALQLKKEFGIPFISAIRHTDLYYFMRFRPDLCLIARDVLRQASALVCLTPTYREAVLARLPTSLAEEIREGVRKDVEVAIIPSVARPTGGAWYEGTDLKAIAKTTGVIEACFYEPSIDRIKADLTDIQVRTNNIGKIKGILRPAFPDLTSEDAVVGAVSELWDGGVKDIGFYNYGHIRSQSLKWIGKALTMVNKK